MAATDIDAVAAYSGLLRGLGVWRGGIDTRDKRRHIFLVLNGPQP